MADSSRYVPPVADYTFLLGEAFVSTWSSGPPAASSPLTTRPTS